MVRRHPGRSALVLAVLAASALALWAAGAGATTRREQQRPAGGDPRQPRPPRPRPDVHQRGLGDRRGHEQRPAHLQEGLRRGGRADRPRHRDVDADGLAQRPDLHVPRAQGRALLAARQPRRAPVRREVLHRAALPHRLGRRRLLHRHQGREQVREDAQGRHLRDRGQRQGGDGGLPPDPARRDVPRLPVHPVRLRPAQGHARQGHLHHRQLARGHRAVRDLEVRAQAGDRHHAEPELPPVDAELAQRAPRRDPGQDRDHARAGRERDRQRPARLVLRVRGARPADRGQGPLPAPGLRLRAQQHHVLLHEHAQAAVRQAGGAAGGQLRHRPQRAGQDLRRPGNARREHPAAGLRRRLQGAPPLPLQPGQGQGPDQAVRRRRHVGHGVGPQHRPDPEGRRSTWPGC